MQVVVINFLCLNKHLGRWKGKKTQNRWKTTKKIHKPSSKIKVQDLPHFLLFLLKVYQTTCVLIYHIKTIDASTICITIYAYQIVCINVGTIKWSGYKL